MESKKKPIWSTGINTTPNGEPVQFLFKDGDDIRQDQLTLQLIKIMDKIWLDNGWDFRMTPYKALSTLDMIGFIEVVKRSTTTGKIHAEQGGTFGALSESTILQYLKKHNVEDFEKAKTNFIYSCAGYCVATYVLGKDILLN